jgi:hypothetical protein
VEEIFKLSKYKGNIPAKIINFFYITKQWMNILGRYLQIWRALDETKVTLKHDKINCYI